MSAEAPSSIRTFRVGRFTATVTIPLVRSGAPAAAAIEWEPHLPQRLTPAELAQYRRGRDAALRELSAELGLNVLVLEL